jgi:HTH-type transcriptional regulator / antitoxin HipB
MSSFDDRPRCRRSVTFLLSPYDDIYRMSSFDDMMIGNRATTMKVTTAQEVGRAIRDQRRELGLSQQALADRVEVGRQWIVAIEQGKPRAEIGLVLRTLDVLGLQASITSAKSSREIALERVLPDAQRKKQIDINAIIERARKWST